MLKKIQLCCKLTKLNWSLLPGLPDRLQTIGFKDFAKPEINIWRYPLDLTFDDFSDAIEHVKMNGEPRGYDIWLRAKGGLTGFAQTQVFHLQRYRSRWDDEDTLAISFHDHDCAEDLNLIAQFLGFEQDTPAAKPSLRRSCFIAHRFNAEGDELAERLSRFLQLLGFDTTSGRAFAPGSVAEKVKGRLAERSIVFAILTSGDDKTWLVQESLLASLSEKPVFLLKEDSYIHNGGLLSDHEYIPFKSPRIETSFIPIIEGLRELGFKFK